MMSLLGPDAELRWANWLKLLQISQSLILYRSRKIVTKFTRDHFFGPFDIDYYTRVLYFDVQTGTKSNPFLDVFVYGVVLLLASCTNRHQNKPIFSCTLVYKRAPEQAFFSCLSFWDGGLSRFLYFMYKQAPNQTNFLVVYVYGVVLFFASCTSMYKQAPKQTYLNLFMFTGWCFYSHLVLWTTNGHQNKPSF